MSFMGRGMQIYSIESGSMMAQVSFPYLFKSRVALLYEIYTGVRPPCSKCRAFGEAKITQKKGLGIRSDILHKKMDVISVPCVYVIPKDII